MYRQIICFYNKLMWYVKKAASKVLKVSQKVFKQQSQVQKLIKDIISNKHDVMPTKKMSSLSAQSFEIDKFEKIVQFMIEKLNDINIQKKSLKKRLNLLVLMAYLIKHGASGFIDEFRSNVQIFTKYQNLINTESVQQDNKIACILIQIRDRAKYIKTLLKDKAVLMREKEVGRLIREKLALQGGDYSKQNPSQKPNQAEKQQSQKVESFLQHYVWRYTQKLDRKVNDITDAIIQKIDQYLDGQMPEGFQIDEVQIKQKKSITRSQFEFTGMKQIQKQEIFIKQKLPETNFNKNINLLDLQSQMKCQAKQIDLIDMNEKQNILKNQIYTKNNNIESSNFNSSRNNHYEKKMQVEKNKQINGL